MSYSFFNISNKYVILFKFLSSAEENPSFIVIKLFLFIMFILFNAIRSAILKETRSNPHNSLTFNNLTLFLRLSSITLIFDLFLFVDLDKILELVELLR